MRYYQSPVPSRDDFGHLIIDVFVDGRTKMGSWAIMNPLSFAHVGVGIGLGKGQRYRRQQDGSWMKEAG